MSGWVELTIGPQSVLIQESDIMAVLERKGSAESCDVYTSAFPAGITVDHSYTEIAEMLLGAEDDTNEEHTSVDDIGTDVSTGC